MAFSEKKALQKLLSKALPRGTKVTLYQTYTPLCGVFSADFSLFHCEKPPEETAVLCLAFVQKLERLHDFCVRSVRGFEPMDVQSAPFHAAKPRHLSLGKLMDGNL